MKIWKLWLAGSCAVVGLAVVAILAAVWNDLSPFWRTQATTAQYALNHTPLDAIASSTTYSGPGGVEQVFVGHDVFGRAGVAIVSVRPLTAVFTPTHALVSHAQVIALAHRYGPDPASATLGYLSPGERRLAHTTATFVWEITYRARGQYRYVYLNALTGTPWK